MSAATEGQQSTSSSSCLPPELRHAGSSSATADSSSDQTREIQTSGKVETTADTYSAEHPEGGGEGGDTADPPAHATSSIFSRSESAPIHLVPMSVIRRPLPSELDEDKVQTFMDEMEVRDLPLASVALRNQDPTSQVK